MNKYVKKLVKSKFTIHSVNKNDDKIDEMPNVVPFLRHCCLLNFSGLLGTIPASSLIVLSFNTADLYRSSSLTLIFACLIKASKIKRLTMTTVNLVQSQIARPPHVLGMTMVVPKSVPNNGTTTTDNKETIPTKK